MTWRAAAPLPGAPFAFTGLSGAAGAGASAARVLRLARLPRLARVGPAGAPGAVRPAVRLARLGAAGPAGWRGSLAARRGCGQQTGSTGLDSVVVLPFVVTGPSCTGVDPPRRVNFPRC